MKIKLLLIIALIPLFSLSQTQIGQDIDGEFTSDQFGFGVSISDNGNIIAVGAPNNDANGDSSGNVRIFENINNTWSQIGQSLVGESSINFFGYSLDLSSSGNIVAIGAYFNDGNGNDSGHVRVFENQSGIWVQIGADIDGELNNDQSGFSVSLSSSGNIVAIGAIGSSGYLGQVRIFENQSGVWTQLGQDIDGESSFDRSGFSVSLSSNGNIVAIGARDNGGNGYYSGHVRIFENQSGVWTQLGQDIDGESSFDRSGSSVSLSSNGNIVAIGAPDNDPIPSTLSGHVRVFEYQFDNWVQIGQDIDGESNADKFGSSVSISSDGSLVAIGAYQNDNNFNNSGQIKVYKFQNSNWVQIGQDILGESEGMALGNRLNISSDGNSIIAGLPFVSANGYLSGLARVYSIASELALLEVVDDILGNLNGVNITADQLNNINGVSGAIEGINYTTALDNGIYVDENNPTALEIQFIIDQVNATLNLNVYNIFKFELYPNPAKSQFTVKLNEGLQLEKLNIYNSLGQFINSTNDTVVDTSKLSSGMYYVEIITNEGKATKKLVIE